MKRLEFPFWGSIFTVIGVFILFGLGIWQVERLKWKENLVERVQKESMVDAASVHVDPDEDLTEIFFKRGFLQGEYLHDKAIFIQARTNAGRPGYHLITPFRLSEYNKKVVFVNRGWVPIGMEMSNKLIDKPRGLMRIVGALRSQPKDNSFVPENSPEKDQWYRIRPDEIAQNKRIESYYTNIFYKEPHKNVREITRFPLQESVRLNFSNNHAVYALTWFSMILVLLGVYYARFISPQRRKLFR